MGAWDEMAQVFRTGFGGGGGQTESLARKVDIEFRFRKSIPFRVRLTVGADGDSSTLGEEKWNALLRLIKRRAGLLEVKRVMQWDWLDEEGWRAVGLAVKDLQGKVGR